MILILSLVRLGDVNGRHDAISKVILINFIISGSMPSRLKP